VLERKEKSRHAPEKGRKQKENKKQGERELENFAKLKILGREK
jgi:hypothetical protein